MHLDAQDPLATFSASACHFVHWDRPGPRRPRDQLDAGRTIVQGCTFMQSSAVQVGAKVQSAILSSNQAVGGFRVVNNAGRRTQVFANEADPLDAVPEGKAALACHNQRRRRR